MWDNKKCSRYFVEMRLFEKELDRYRLESGKIYLDNAATSLKSPLVLKNFYEYGLKFPLNPMSVSNYSTGGKDLLSNARREVLNYFRLSEQDYQVLFTSGSTEGLNLVLQSVFLSDNRSEIITSSLEHKAVLDTIYFLESIGAEVTFIKHDKCGLLSMNHLSEAISENVSFVSLMHVNNEIGNINDIEQISTICRETGVPFICDTTQSVGKIKFNGELCDAFVGSAHKFGGPFGIGFLILKKGLITNPLQHGGNQEFGLRPGTHNLPGILAMIDALQSDCKFKKSLIKQVLADLGLDINARIGKNGCDYILAFRVNDIVAFEELNPGYIFGRGSACNSGLQAPSHVYSALGYDENVIRISF